MKKRRPVSILPVVSASLPRISFRSRSMVASFCLMAVVGVLVQNHGGELVKRFDFATHHGWGDHLRHALTPAAGAKKVSSRSRINAADCSGGRLFTSIRSTSKPA
jgi:hypothetical protein